MKYAATQNVPGYLPWDDDGPPVFDTAQEAWLYLADERRMQEDNAYDADPDNTMPDGQAYSDTVQQLDAKAAASQDRDFRTGTVYGSTPGDYGPYDLGIAYSVTEAED